jgi:hypothetical protein|tara:strand:+ start:159 stop:395 length:237 start_codon:yes stop_codon:yes gene_type:complete
MMWTPVGKLTNIVDEYWEKKFAWWPVNPGFGGRRIWLTWYWIYVIRIDKDGRVPMKTKQWEMVYTQEEYIMRKLSNIG